MTARIGILITLLLTAVMTALGTSGWWAASLTVITFLLGVAVGVVAKDLWAEHQRRKHALASKSEDERRKARHEWNVMTGLGLSLLAIALATGITGVLLLLSRQATERYSECTAQWQEQFSRAYSARSDASLQVNEAIDAVIYAVSANDDKGFDVAVSNYVKVREEQNQKRLQSPLPPLPEVLCGKR